MKFATLAALVAVAHADDITIDLRGLTAEQGQFDVAYGSTVTVTAVENRSTGYSWGVQNECGARFALDDDTYGYEELKDGVQDLAFGKQGRRTMKFKAVTADSNSLQDVPCELTFTYKRPWLDSADSEDDVKTIIVNVGNGETN